MAYSDPGIHLLMVRIGLWALIHRSDCRSCGSFDQQPPLSRQQLAAGYFNACVQILLADAERENDALREGLRKLLNWSWIDCGAPHGLRNSLDELLNKGVSDVE